MAATSRRTGRITTRHTSQLPTSSQAPITAAAITSRLIRTFSNATRVGAVSTSSRTAPTRADSGPPSAPAWPASERSWPASQVSATHTGSDSTFLHWPLKPPCPAEATTLPLASRSATSRTESLWISSPASRWSEPRCAAADRRTPRAKGPPPGAPRTNDRWQPGSPASLGRNNEAPPTINTAITRLNTSALLTCKPRGNFHARTPLRPPTCRGRSSMFPPFLSVFSSPPFANAQTAVRRLRRFRGFRNNINDLAANFAKETCCKQPKQQDAKQQKQPSADYADFADSEATATTTSLAVSSEGCRTLYFCNTRFECFESARPV